MVHKTLAIVISFFLLVLANVSWADDVHIYGTGASLEPYRFGGGNYFNYSGVVGETSTRHHPIMTLRYDATREQVAQFEVWYPATAADNEGFNLSVYVTIPSTDVTKQACLRAVYRVTTYGALWDYNNPGVHNGAQYVDAAINAADSSGNLITVSLTSLPAIDDYSNVACFSESAGTCQGKHGWVAIIRLPDAQCANNVNAPVNIAGFDWYFTP